LLIKTETIVGLFMLTALAVFIYMSFKMGICRLDTIRYAQYSTYFKDVSGLREKADACIAGVRIGWVEKIHLISNESHVRVDLMLDRNSIIYSDAFATVRQDGLLGTKYIEINPGDSLNPMLPPGSTLLFPSKPPTSIDELLFAFKEIASNVQEVTSSLKNIIGENKNNSHGLSQLIIDVQSAFQSINNIANNSNALIQKNDVALTNLIHDFSYTVSDLKDRLPYMIESLKNGVDNFSQSFSSASLSFKEIIGPLENVSKKLNSNDGVLGSLINDSNLAKDLKGTVKSVKKYFTYSDKILLNVDTHVESMQAPGNDLDFKDAKGFMNFIIRPSDDLSYIIGITSAYAGVVKRTRTDTMWMDQAKHPIIPDIIDLPNWAKLQYAPVREEYIRDYSALTYNVQFAKDLGRLKLRTGLFESTFGVGLDYDIPLIYDIKWISSFEVYRFDEFMSQTLGGRMVFDIDLPHLKWFNRIFVNDSCYFVFGADDFISKFNKNFFVGMGLAFEQNDLKYVISKIK
jgi:phospholipid/cholesterol/gamma-HCH transport system substrate-binding protein